MRKIYPLILLLISVLSFARHAQAQTLVGSGQTYTTLKAAFDAINTGTLTGDVVLQITSSTTETATAALNATGGSANYSSVTIYPTGSGYTISGSVAGAIIQLNGADYVTIDGRVNQSGAKDLIIQNTNTSNSTIQLTADATYNTVKYCVIKGATTSTSNGIVLISTGTSIGNDNNTIDNNDINANGTAVNCIYATGSSGIVNNAITVSSNNIFDFRGASSNGIYLQSYNSDWTIDGNSIYQTTSYTGASGTTYGIQIGSTGIGNGFVIQNNKIGGSSANCTGTWTISGTAATFRFQGINLNVGTSTASSIQNNTIKGFSWLSSSGAGTVPGIWCGIHIASGLANVGNSTGNTIGSSTGTGSITANVTTSGAVSFGIANASSSANTISNNSIGSITVTGNTTSISHGFVGMVTSSGNTTISNNTIGSTSTSNSINASTASTNSVGQPVIGIWSSSTGTVTINNNTVANINNAYGGTGTSTFFGQLRGILIGSALSTSVAEINTSVTVNGNSIYNLSSSIPYTNTSQTSAVIGLCVLVSSTSVASTVSQNIIYGITSSASAITELDGIFIKTGTLSSGSNLFEKNLIHSLSAASTSAVNGIKVNAGKNTFQNNMIRLGIDIGGNSITNALAYSGINDNIGTNSYYFNSVYLGGTGVTNTTSTYAFNSQVSTNARAFQNNIFVNNRSFTSAGAFYNAAYYISSTPSSGAITGLTSNYNILYANGTGGIAVRNGSNYYTLRQWREANYATNQDLNSGYGDPNFTNATSDISTTPTTYALKVQGTTPAEASGILIASVTDDVEGNSRSSLTPTDIGADAGDYTASDIFTPTISYTALGNTSAATNRTLSNVTIADIGTAVPTSGGNAPRIWYKKNAGGTWVSKAGTLASGNGNSGTWNFEIDYSVAGFGGAPIASDVIYYYIVAQDQTGTPNIWYSPFVGTAHTDVNTQTTAPTTPNSYTILNTFAGTISVGTGQTYTTLTSAGGLFAAINAGVVTGNLVINIVSDITETGTNALNQWIEEGTGNYTLTIQSDGSLRTLSNSTNLLVPLIKINGADRVTIDGLSGKNILFRNTNTSGSSTTATVLFDNGSTSCTLTNCIIENNSTSTSNGSVQVNTTGTNDITISSNEIRNPTAGTINDYYQGIYSNSSTNKLNISNNSIYNWTNYGIRLNAAADACTVSGNSLYRTSSWSATSVTVIAVKGGNGHTISGNYIGGNAASCGGSALTNTGNVFFMGLDVTNIGTTSTTNVTNNTFQNIILSGTGSVTFLGICGGSSKLNVGSSVGTGNLIGHPSTAQSIQVSGTNTTAFTGISLNGTGSATVYGINYNEIANIYITANTAVKAIDIAAASAAVASITYNNVHDITAFNTGTTTAIRGINNSGTSGGTLTISNNTISNLTSTTTNTGTTTSFSAIGILCTSTVNTQNITNNTISNLNLTTSGNNAVKSAGIMVSGSSSSGSISKNIISDFTNTSTSTTNQMTGIYLNNGSFTVDNNVISLANGANTNVLNLQGILDAVGALGTNNYYFNSVYIGGSTNSGALNSFAFSRSATTTTVVKNNILNNQRTGGTGKHIAIALQSSTITSDYNDLYASNTANIGSVNGGTAGLDFATWKSTTNQDANSYSTDPNFTSTTNLKPTAGNYLAGTNIATITTDFDGITRSNPPDIGAYEGSEAGRWLGTSSTDWATTTNWDNGALPTASDNVTIITGAANMPQVTQDPASPAVCNNLTINTGQSLTVNAGKALTVNGTITNNGTLSVKSDATGTGSLITSATPSATVERYMSKDNYHYISSPVASQAISTEFINTSGGGTLPSEIDFYTWDETQLNSWINIKQADFTLNPAFETNFGVCKGYVYANSSSAVTKNFTGTLNSGDKTVTLTKSPLGQRGWNMVGNPFASSVAVNVSADATNNLLTLNTASLNDSREAIYLWNQTTPNTSTHTTNEYLAINQASPATFLSPGQAFMVSASANSVSFSLPQAARKHGSATFYKSGTEDEVNRFWLTVEGPQNNFNETMVALIPGTTNGMDAGYDAQKLKGNVNIALYTRLVDGSEGDYAIQSIDQLSGNFVVPVGLDANLTGNYTFKAGRMDNLEAVTVQLEDRISGTFTTLSNGGEYSIAVGTKGTINNRFFLHLKSTVGIDDPANQEASSIYSYGNQLYIQNPGKATLEVYSMTGQRVMLSQINTTGLYQTTVSQPTGYYVVRLTNAGSTQVSKVFIK